LRDIGNLAIPDKLLRQSEPGSQADRFIIQQHPVIGHRILSRIKFLQESALLVLHHHEHYDGSGYPRGLEGEQIDLGARIFAVVEEFDRLISAGHSGGNPGFTSAVRKIREKAGKLLDPEIVEKLAQIPTSEWEEVYRQIPVSKNGCLDLPAQL